MDKHKKLLLQILRGQADANIKFNDLRLFLLHLGFEERVKGSHHIFRKKDITEKINLQRDGNKAKVYQVRQVRSILLTYKLKVENE